MSQANADLDAVMAAWLKGRVARHSHAPAAPRIFNAVVVVDYPARHFHYERAVGVARAGDTRQMTVLHQFPVASVTKTMTAAVILQLAEEGSLGPKGIDATLGELEVLPRAILDRLDVYQGTSYGAELTLQQLLGHRSGMRDVFMDDEQTTAADNHGVAVPGSLGGRFLSDLPHHVECLRQSQCDRAGLLTTRNWVPWDPSRPNESTAGVINYYINNGRIGSTPLFAPGAGYHYSDTGYILLGLVIEHVTGKTLHQVYRERLFDPLDLENTYLEYASDPPAQRFERKRCDYFIGDIGGWTSGLNLSFDWAGGGVVSTAGDLSRFVRALGEGRLFRNPDSLARMSRWHWHRIRDGLPEDRGLGIEQIHAPDGSVFWGHFGFWGAAMFYEPATGITIAGTLDQVGVASAQWVAEIFAAVHGASGHSGRGCKAPRDHRCEASGNRSSAKPLKELTLSAGGF